MKNSRKYRPEFLFLTLSIGIALLFVCLETSSPGTQTSAAVSLTGLSNATETVEATVTLSGTDAIVKTWKHGYQWYSKLPYCGPPFHMWPPLDDIPGSVFVGYSHYYDKGAKVFGCPDGASAADRGTVWFDLSSIVGKAPPLHVSVKSAMLHFKKNRECPSEELLIAKEDWRKEGYPEETFVPGDPLGIIPACAPPECVRDVTTVVNNWVRGEDHGGYANYGFVFKGPREADLDYTDNDDCMTRYSDFSLTVTYRYDKTAVLYVPPPQKPATQVSKLGGILSDLPLAQVNLALKKTATQSSTLPGGEAYRAVDGNTDGVAADGSVAYTDLGSQAWWQVDLGSIRSIQNIKVWNRAEAPGRTSDFYVFVSDEPFKSTDLEATKTQVGLGRSFFTAGQCGTPTEITVKKTGRYVRVQLSGTNYLQLAEVEVFAGPK
ncbi:MAG TPA: discoidin domain-containing protein [Pyrinomonadaceae bacterium]|nr:discoidin domain-containing protein [Pyrinomonadaceae bacterium]